MSDATTPTKMAPGQYATRLGISLQALRDASRKHRMPWQPGSGEIDVRQQDAAWARAHRAGAVKTPPPADMHHNEEDDDAEDDSLASGKRRKVNAEARLVELRLQRMQAELIPVLEVEHTWMRISGAINGVLDSLPARLAGVLPGEPFQIAAILRTEIRAVREELAEQVELAAEEAEAEAKKSDDDDEELPPEVDEVPEVPKSESGSSATKFRKSGQSSPTTSGKSGKSRKEVPRAS